MDKNDMHMPEHESQVTIDHDEIKAWAEERDGSPAVVKGTRDEDGGILRIDFSDKEEDLEPIGWDEFFKIFEEKNLAFLYQNKAADGSASRFFKLVDRDESEDEESDDDEDLDEAEEDEEEEE